MDCNGKTSAPHQASGVSQFANGAECAENVAQHIMAFRVKEKKRKKCIHSKEQT